MADNMDPRALAEYQSILQSVQGILEDIVMKEQGLAAVTQQVTDAANQRREILEQNIQLAFRQAEAAGQALDAEEKRNLLLQTHRQNLQDELTKHTTLHLQNQRNLAQTQEQIRTLTAELNSLSQQGVTSGRQIDSIQDKINSAKSEEFRLQAEINKLTDDQRQKIAGNITAEMQYHDAKMKSSQSAQSAMRTLFGLDNQWRETLAGSMYQTMEAAVKATNTVQKLGAALSNMTTTLGNIASAGNVVGSTVMKIQETTIHMVTSLDRADVGFRSLTGNARGFEGEILGAFEDREIKEMAASLAEVQQAQGALYSIARQYSSEQEPMRREMTRTALAAKRFGVSFETSAEVMNKANKVFGVDGPSMMNKLYNSAVAIGETPARMVQNFSEAVNIMAQYSLPRAIEVLQGLSAISKETGVSMSTLQGVAMQFDTFETAAGQVARLNAILGGAYYNSVQMLNAEENERLYLLKAGLDATNRSWESLGRWERKAFAAAAGFKDLNTAAAFFQGNMAKVDELTKQQELQAESQRRMIMMGGQVVDVMQQIARVFQDAGIYIDDIVGIVRKAVNVFKELGFEGVALTGIFFSLTKGLAGYVSQAMILKSATAGASVGLSSMGAALVGLAPLLLGVGAAWLYLSDKLTEEKSPPAYSLLNIAGQGAASLAANARAAATPVANLGNKINMLSDEKIVSLTQALGMASRISAPDLQFGPATASISEITRAVNALDERKVNSFSNAMARLGATMQMIPRENVVAVTQLTKEARSVSALPVAAAARSAASVSAQGAAVRMARASETGGGGRAEPEGVLLNNLTVNVGDKMQFRVAIQDEAKAAYRKIQARSA